MPRQWKNSKFLKNHAINLLLKWNKNETKNKYLNFIIGNDGRKAILTNCSQLPIVSRYQQRQTERIQVRKLRENHVLKEINFATRKLQAIEKWFDRIMCLRE